MRERGLSLSLSPPPHTHPQCQFRVGASAGTRGWGPEGWARSASASFQASWPDALPMISERLPEVANRATDQLANGEGLDGCLRELATASEQLDRHGFVGRGQIYDGEPAHPSLFRWSQELIEKWEHQLQDGQPVRRPPSEHSEVILVERQR